MTLKEKVLLINGEYGEGGGAILRTSVPLAVLMQTPLKVTNIRKNRKNPGLREQHLQGLRALADLTCSEIKGLSHGSTEIMVQPGQCITSELHVNIRTAGSIPLLLQILQNFAVGLGSESVAEPFSSFTGEFRVHVTGGGTHTKWAPTIEFIHELLIPILRTLGVDVNVHVKKYGFYPKGGARAAIEFRVHARKPTAFMFREMTRIDHVHVHAVISKGLKQTRVGERILKRIEELNKSIPSTMNLETMLDYVDSDSFGGGVQISCFKELEYALGGSALAEKKRSSEQVASQAWKEFIQQVHARVNIDTHLSDQLLLPFVVNNVRSKFTTLEMTSHALTNQWILSQFDFPMKILMSKDSLERTVIEMKRFDER